MLFGVPDSYICPDGPDDPVYGCDPSEVNTSHRNKFIGNIMGRTPAGKRKPNGLDFWWDNIHSQKENCWQKNRGKRGTAASLTSLPSTLPFNCATSTGTDPDGNAQQIELLQCVLDEPGCTWFQKPPKPGN
jgi:hypothetical protein